MRSTQVLLVSLLIAILDELLSSLALCHQVRIGRAYSTSSVHSGRAVFRGLMSQA